MSEITFGFSKPRKFAIFSLIIRLIEKRPYSHVYLKWTSEWLERDIIYQAKSTMVHFIGGKLFRKSSCPIIEYSFDITDERKNELIKWCMDNAGLSYGMLHILGMGYVRFWEFLGIKNIPNPFSDDDDEPTHVCSKLAAIALVDILKAADLSREELNTAGPSKIEKILKQVPGVKIREFESC